MRAEGLWFEDCSLIIQAERTLFRVSGHFLATRSPVFADMISLPTPKDAETKNGCPFVLLPDRYRCLFESVDLLRVIFFSFFALFPAPTTFSVLASVLRMSHKYEVDYLQKRALMHLSSVYPTTLLEWEHINSTSCALFPETDSEHLDLVLLTRHTSATWILPAAFYRVCQSVDEDSIINGTDLRELSASDKPN
ncbi:hypothetical protein B0H14DRAFT_2422079 [Mycena olivaceomarginata]|nr:hypothetical protein B0H14DRAFT_2422079 [Mycena olivaceomarginata]